jgi:hypothetical protein
MGKKLEKYRASQATYSYKAALEHLVAQLHPELDKEDIDYVVEILIGVVEDKINEHAKERH